MDTMVAQDNIKTSFIFNIMLKAAQITPPRLASWMIHRFADFSMLRHRQSDHIKAMTANQKIIHQGKLSPQELKRIVRRTLINRVYFQYELYHHLHSFQHLYDQVTLSPNAAEYFNDPYAAMLVGPHLGNFDLMGWTIAKMIPHVQTISVANPPLIYQLENKYRAQAGIDVTPASINALSEAMHRLRAGKPVITGIERPFPDARYTPRFFGLPAALPDVHIRLALKAEVPVIVMAVLHQDDGSYRFEASKPIHMQTNASHDIEIIHNAEVVLKAAENLILNAPDQWFMFYPVWPETLEPHSYR